MRLSGGRESVTLWLSPQEQELIARYARLHKVTKHKAMRMMMADGAEGSGVPRRLLGQVREVVGI